MSVIDLASYNRVLSEKVRISNLLKQAQESLANVTDECQQLKQRNRNLENEAGVLHETIKSLTETKNMFEMRSNQCNYLLERVVKVSQAAIGEFRELQFLYQEQYDRRVQVEQDLLLISRKLEDLDKSGKLNLSELGDLPLFQPMTGSEEAASVRQSILSSTGLSIADSSVPSTEKELAVAKIQLQDTLSEFMRFKEAALLQHQQLEGRVRLELEKVSASSVSPSTYNDTQSDYGDNDIGLDGNHRLSIFTSATDASTSKNSSKRHAAFVDNFKWKRNSKHHQFSGEPSPTSQYSPASPDTIIHASTSEHGGNKAASGNHYSLISAYHTTATSVSSNNRTSSQEVDKNSLVSPLSPGIDGLTEIVDRIRVMHTEQQLSPLKSPELPPALTAKQPSPPPQPQNFTNTNQSSPSTNYNYLESSPSVSNTAAAATLRDLIEATNESRSTIDRKYQRAIRMSQRIQSGIAASDVSGTSIGGAAASIPSSLYTASPSAISATTTANSSVIMAYSSKPNAASDILATGASTNANQHGTQQTKSPSMQDLKNAFDELESNFRK